MNLAVTIRSFFETLLTGRLVVQLRADLDEARSQRDYFKGRAERLELLLTQPRFANRDLSNPAEASRVPRTHSAVGGRKTWAQLVRERREELNEKAKQAESAKKPATSAPVAQN